MNGGWWVALALYLLGAVTICGWLHEDSQTRLPSWLYLLVLLAWPLVIIGMLIWIAWDVLSPRGKSE